MKKGSADSVTMVRSVQRYLTSSFSGSVVGGPLSSTRCRHRVGERVNIPVVKLPRSSDAPLPSSAMPRCNLPRLFSSLSRSRQADLTCSGNLRRSLTSHAKGPALGWRFLSTRNEGDPASGDFAADVGDCNSVDCNGVCWKCGSAVHRRDFFCECGAAQLLDGRLSYFEMFRSPPSIFLEMKQVEKEFKTLQRAFHPDLFAGKCDDEQAISAANSATANKAYQTLVKPMQRVKYLMRTLGSTALEEEGGKDSTPVPSAFLIEIMDTRESLEECASKEDAEEIMNEASAQIEACLHRMDKALKAGGDKNTLADDAVRLRYLYRIEDEGRRVMHRFEDEQARPMAD